MNTDFIFLVKNIENRKLLIEIHNRNVTAHISFYYLN